MKPHHKPPQASPILRLPDPPIAMGSFRALPRTTGGFVVIDDRLPLAEKAVRFCTSESAARVAVTELGMAEWRASHRETAP